MLIYIALLGLSMSAAALGLIFLLFPIYYFQLGLWMSSCPLLLLYSPWNFQLRIGWYFLKKTFCLWLKTVFRKRQSKSWYFEIWNFLLASLSYSDEQCLTFQLSEKCFMWERKNCLISSYNWLDLIPSPDCQLDFH